MATSALSTPRWRTQPRPSPGHGGLRRQAEGPRRDMAMAAVCRRGRSAQPATERSSGANPRRSASPPTRRAQGTQGTTPRRRSDIPSIPSNYREAERRQREERAREQMMSKSGLRSEAKVIAAEPGHRLPPLLEKVVVEWERFNESPAAHPLHLASVISSSGYIMGLAVAMTEVISGVEDIALTPAVFAGFGIGALYATLLRFANIRIWAAPKRSKTVVITGSARGIGKALAREFLQAGDRVVITSRSEKGVAAAVRELREEVGVPCVVYGISCEVTSPSSVARLASMSQSLLGSVDIWINNAAYSGSYKPFLDFTDSQLGDVVRTNLLGSLYCTKAAFKLMERQGSGHIFNMDGAGADMSATPNYSAYGSTKAAIAHLMKTLQAEANNKGMDIGVHTLSPGMVLTKLLLEGATLRNKQVFNILCEHPETAAGFLVPRIRSAVALNKREQYIQYLTPWRALSRFLTAPLRVGRFFDAAGQAGYLSEYERILGKGAEDTQKLLDWVRRRDTGLILSYSFTMAVTHAVFVYDAIQRTGV